MSLVTVAFSQIMIVTEEHVVSGFVEVVDPNPSNFLDRSERLAVAARVSVAFPGGEVLERQVQITSYERDRGEFRSYGTELRISVSDARVLVENIAALEAIQAQLRSFESMEDGNRASAAYPIEIVSSSNSDFVGTVERFVVRSDYFNVPFMFRSLTVISDQPEEKRRALDELSRLIGAAVDYIDTNY
jgi:hypothetical protein